MAPPRKRVIGPEPFQVRGIRLGRGTAFAVFGVSVGVLGVAMGEFAPYGGGAMAFFGFLVAVIGVGISCAGALAEITETRLPPSSR